MATASVTYALSNGTTADATQVNTNFTDLVDFINTHVVHKDGAITMTGLLTLTGSDPSVANHATRKSYVDARDTHAWARMFASSGTAFSTVSAFETWYYQTTPFTITNPNIGAINIFAIAYVSGQGPNGEAAIRGAVDISIDGGSNYTGMSTVVWDRTSGTESLGWWTVNPHNSRMNVTPTGDIKVRTGINQATSFSSKASVDGYHILVLISSVSL